MKITYLHQYFVTPDMNGGTRSYEFARRMVSAGHEVHIVTTDRQANAGAGSWRTEMIKGINVHWLSVPYNNKMTYPQRLVSFFRYAVLACGYANKIKSDIIFASSTPLTVAIPAVWVSKWQKIPMVFEVRDLWPEVPIAMGVLKNPILKFLARSLEKFAYDNANAIIGLSPGMCAGIIRRGYPPEKVTCLPNSADIELFRVPERAGKDYRSARPWLQDRPLVAYLGTFGRVNGVGYLVDIAREMKNIDDDIRFLAIGDGAEFAQVKSRAETENVLGENMFIEAAISKSEMPSIMSASTICVSLTIDNQALWNNSANKVFDAMAAGRPIGVNYGGWQAELLEETGAGIQLPPDDAKAGAKILRDFLRSPDKLAYAHKSSSQLAVDRFSRDVIATKLIDKLEAVFDQGRNN